MSSQSRHEGFHRWRKTVDTTEGRSSAGYAGHAGPQGDFIRTAPRVRYYPAHSAVVGRDVDGRARLSVSGALPDRTARLDQFQVERERDRPPGQVLQSDQGGPQAAFRRGQELRLARTR